jgi:hypothetical protein
MHIHILMAYNFIEKDQNTLLEVEYYMKTNRFLFFRIIS